MAYDNPQRAQLSGAYPAQEPRYATDVATAAPRKPTAAEYTEKRVAEAANLLHNELDRLEGQYFRLRQHFGIPPEPANPSGGAKEVAAGMEGQINRLAATIGALSEIVSKMNELI